MNYKNDKLIIDPYYLTGITDGEGNFYISIYEDKRRSNKPQVRFFFKVSQRDHSVNMLYALANFLNCGSVTIENKNTKTMRFVVNNIEDIEKRVIPHFDKYPLISSKRLNYESFKKAFIFFKNGEHLKPEGLSQIIAIKNSMNKGRPFEDKFYSVGLPKNIIIKPSWLQGLADGEGSFGVYLNATNSIKEKNIIEISIKTDFNIGQNIHDISILDAIKMFFGKGFIKPKLKDFSDINEIKSTCLNAANYINNDPHSFLPFFKEYPLITQKQLDLLDFIKFYELKQSKAYLKLDGFKLMLEIAQGMNSGRFGKSKRNIIQIPEWNQQTKVIIK